MSPGDSAPPPSSDQLASYLQCCSTDISLQVVSSTQRGATHTGRIQMVHFPLLTCGGRGGLCVGAGVMGGWGGVCTGVQAGRRWNKDDGGTIGVQLHAEEQGR